MGRRIGLIILYIITVLIIFFTGYHFTSLLEKNLLLSRKKILVQQIKTVEYTISDIIFNMKSDLVFLSNLSIFKKHPTVDARVYLKTFYEKYNFMIKALQWKYPNNNKALSLIRQEQNYYKFEQNLEYMDLASYNDPVYVCNIYDKSIKIGQFDVYIDMKKFLNYVVKKILIGYEVVPWYIVPDYQAYFLYDDIFYIDQNDLNTILLDLEEGLNGNKIIKLSNNNRVDDYITTYISLNLFDKKYLFALSRSRYSMVREIYRTKIIIFITFTLIIVLLFVAFFLAYRKEKLMRKSIKEVEVLANDLALELQREYRIKSHILEDICHELKTPLNAIVGFSGLILEAKQNQPQFYEHFLKAINEGGKQLSKVLDEIVEWSSEGNKQFFLRERSLKIYKLTRSLQYYFEPLIRERNIKFSVSIDSNIPDILLGDERRIRYILFNLINFIINLSYREEIKLNFDFLDKQDDYITIKFSLFSLSLTNHHNIIKHILESKRVIYLDKNEQKYFYELLTAHRFLGMMQNDGLKLKKISSNKYVISFILNLKEQNQDKGTQEVPIVDFTGKNALVVDDQPVNRILTKVLLQRLNIECKEAENGKEALELFKENKFDWIFMDVRMPELDGLEATRMMRQIEEMEDRPRTPIIGVTAHANERDCFEAGMDMWLSKPITPEIIEKALRNVKV